jgi:hypothetical protein
MNHDHLQYHREKTGALQSILLLSNVQLLVYRSYVDTGRRYFLSLKTAFSRFMYAYAVFIPVPVCLKIQICMIFEDAGTLADLLMLGQASADATVKSG